MFLKSSLRFGFLYETIFVSIQWIRVPLFHFEIAVPFLRKHLLLMVVTQGGEISRSTHGSFPFSEFTAIYYLSLLVIFLARRGV